MLVKDNAANSTDQNTCSSLVVILSMSGVINLHV